MKLKRIIAMVLCFAMVLSTMSFSVFAEGTFVAKVGDVECADATQMLKALNAASGEVTVGIYGKLETSGFGLNNSNITKLSFVAESDDAEICVDGVSYIDVRNTNYPIEYTGLTLSHINAGQNIDGFLPQYFSTYNGGDVTYNDCAFPNGVTACGSEPDTTYKFIDCTFNNTTSGLYSLWIYGNSTNVEVIGGEFCGVRGIKMYSEDSDDFSSLSVSGATFSDTITEKHAVVLTKGESVTLTGNTFNNTTGKVQVDDDYASSIDGKTVTIDGTEYTVDSDNLTLEETAPAETIVATVEGVEYTDIQEAIVAAAPNGTVEIVDDIVVDEWIMFSETLTIGSGQIITIPEINGLTINGNGHSLTVNAIESATNGDCLFFDATNLNINDLTIYYGAGVAGSIGLTSGTISNVTFNGGSNIVFPREGDITITGCTFNTTGTAIYNEVERDNLVVTGNTFNTAAGQYAIYLRGNTTFTNNTVVTGKVNVTNSATGEISGNDFGNERFKVYNAATATIANNKINNLVFNDDSEVKSTFSENTLSAEAEAVLKTAGVIKTNEVAIIGDVKFASLAEAAAAAKAGDTITLIADATIAEETDVTIPDGVILNGNGFTISSLGADHDTTTNYGYIIAGGNLTIEGITKIEKFSASYYDHIITVGEGASLEVFGKNRVSVGYGSSFYVSGTVSDAKTADKSQIQPSLNIAPGLSIVGADDTVFEVKNAYVIIGDTSSKNSNAGGKFDITFENSIVDFTKQFSFSTPKYDTLNPVFNVNVKDSVMTTGTKLMIAASGSVMTIDNSTVALGSYLRNSGELTLKNGSKLTGKMIQFGENGGNDGEIIVDNSEFEIICTSTGHAMDGNGTGVITLKNGSKANISYIQESIINVDAKSALITQLLTDNTVNGAFVEQNDGTHLVGALPEAEVSNLGKISVEKGEGAYNFEDTYYIYDLLGNQEQKMATSSETFDLNIAMQFVSKDTEAEAAKNAYGNYTTDFFIKIDGLENGSFVGDGCYLAGYYPSFGTWVKIPLDGFTVEDGKLYPVITSAGFDFKYTDICASVKNFICGIYLTPEVIGANPDINVNLALGLSETMEDALNAEFTTVDDYTYVADDFIEAASTLSGTGTEEDPFLINNIDDLILFRDSVNAGNNYAGKYVKLNDDIDLSSVDSWTPIGDTTYDKKYAPVDASVVFSGVFDGNDKAISNLKIEKYFDGDPDTDANLGLFGITGEGAVIKDLTITNVDIDTDGRNVGALAGVAHKTVLENIAINGDIQISGGNNVSGVCAMTRYYNMSATNITVSGDNGSSINGNNIVGGIFAEIAPNGSAQTFENLSVENVAINGVGGVGGIVGLLTNGAVSTVSVKNVELVGKTTWKENEGRIRLGSVAGLLGSTSATVSNVVAVENVTAKNLEGEDVVLPVIGANYDASSNATEARIGDTYYATLVKAFAAAKDGDTVTLLTDVDLTSPVVISGKDLTLELGEYTIYDKCTDVLASTNGVWGLISLESGAKLIVEGNGAIRCNYTNVSGGWTGMAYAIDVDNASELIVNGGTFINGNGGIQTRGKVTVNNGTFISHNGGTCIMALNSSANVTVNGGVFKDSVEDSDIYTGSGAVWSGFGATVIINGGYYDFAADSEHGNIVWTLFPAQNAIAGYGENSNMSVCGGTFVNFNPETDVVVGYSSSTGFTFGSVVADGYEANENADGVYAVIELDAVAQVDEDKFETLEEAIAAAQDGDTVTLLSDIELAQTITVANGKKITLDLNGKTITGTDNTEKNFSLIDNRGDLTITGDGKMTLTATVNSGWNRYSAVLANNPGGKLTIESGTIEHLGGTDMAYGIDNLTNGKGTYAETIVNGGTIKSTYRGIRQFLNGVEAQNILTVNGGTVEGANKSIWMQDPSKKANTGILNVGENANLIGDVYLFVTAGSTQWPVEVSIAAAALKDGSAVVTGNVPEKYDVKEINGTYGVYDVVAKIGDVKFGTLQEAIDAANEGDTVTLLSDLTIESELSNAAKGYFNIADGQSIALDLNGKTIKATDNSTGNFVLFYNYGNLTITGNGVVELTSTVDREWNAQSTILLNRGGEMTVESGTFTHNGGTAMAITVDNSGNSFGDAYLTVNGGEIKSSYIAVRMRMADPTLNGNPGNGVVNMTVNGGTIEGTKRGIWGQITNASTEELGNLDISGGTIKGDTAISIATDESANINVKIYGDAYIDGGLSGDISDIVVSGGTFTTKPDDGFAAEGYEFTQNEDNTYGVTEKVVELFDFYASNVTLDNTLALNFYIEKSKFDGTEYYAKIEHSTTTGKTEKIVNYSEWTENGNLFCISYTGMAAKQMSDDITITVYKSDDTQASAALTSSIKAYGLRYLKNHSSTENKTEQEKHDLTAIIDMLNYGAAAQESFNYNTENLANSGAEVYQEYATKEVSADVVADAEHEGIVYGSNLTLESRILYNAYFGEVTEGMHAEVSFTNHYGETYNYEIPYSEFIPNGNYHEICVDKLVIADAAQTITITVYNEDGTVHAWVKESINGYLGRLMKKYPEDKLYPATAKFTNSAYVMLHD